MKNRDPYTIIYEDSHIIVVNKASGISVGGDRWDGTALRLDRLLDRRARVFTVHRIDRDTSGLVVFALDRETHRSLARSFEDRRVEKKYLAAVHGRPSWDEADCDLPLVVDGDKQHRTIIDRYRGKKSRTKFRRLFSVGNCSFVEAYPETGRTHQIRAHLAALGLPVVCDPLYGRFAARSSPDGPGGGLYLSSFKKGWRGDPLGERPLIERLALHAARLVLPRPEEPGGGPPGDGASDDGASGGGAPGDARGRKLEFEAPLPRDMRALKSQMEKSRKEPLTGSS